MRFYSDVTKKLYNTKEDLVNDEAKHQAELDKIEEKKKARAARAKEVEDAYKAAIEANNHYIELRNEFVDDYGSFHCSYTSKAPVQKFADLADTIDLLFNLK